jgi:predicted PurR-regulated permease PerM
MPPRKPGDASTPSITPGPADVRRPEPPPGVATLRAEHLYKAALLLFALAIFFRFFREITQTLLLVYAAAIVAVALNPIARLVPRHRKLVAAAAGAVVLSVLGVGLWLGIPALVDQIRQLAERAPEFQVRLEAWAEWLRQRTGLNIALLGEESAELLRAMFQSLGTEEIFGRARGLLEVLFVPLIILIGGLYALAAPNSRLLDPILRLVPRDRRNAFYRILRLLGERLFGWIRGTAIAMISVGLLSMLALYVIGVQYWLVLGLLIGLVEFIPLLGPWIGGIPAVLIAFLDDPMKGVWAAIAIIVIQQIESWLITPWAMAQAAKIHPLVTLFALIIFGSIFGILGILLALPIVILIWTVVEVLWVERTVQTDHDYIPPVVEE